jgi:hypothetical protein
MNFLNSRRAFCFTFRARSLEGVCSSMVGTPGCNTESADSCPLYVIAVVLALAAPNPAPDTPSAYAQVHI